MSRAPQQHDRTNGLARRLHLMVRRQIEFDASASLNKGLES